MGNSTTRAALPPYPPVALAGPPPMSHQRCAPLQTVGRLGVPGPRRRERGCPARSGRADPGRPPDDPGAPGRHAATRVGRPAGHRAARTALVDPGPVDAYAGRSGPLAGRSGDGRLAT